MLERELDAPESDVGCPGKEMEPSELCCERHEIGVGFVFGKKREGSFHPLDPLLHVKLVEVDLAELRRDPGARVRLSEQVVKRDSTFEVCSRRIGSAGEAGHLTGALFKVRPLEILVGETDGLFEIPLRANGVGERCGALARTHRHLSCSCLHRPRVFSARREFERAAVVGCDDFDDFVLFGLEGTFKI